MNQHHEGQAEQLAKTGKEFDALAATRARPKAGPFWQTNRDVAAVSPGARGTFRRRASFANLVVATWRLSGRGRSLPSAHCSSAHANPSETSGSCLG